MTTESCCSTNKLALVYGALLLRVWLAVRAIQTGIEKFAGSKASDQIVSRRWQRPTNTASPPPAPSNNTPWKTTTACRKR